MRDWIEDFLPIIVFAPAVVWLAFLIGLTYYVVIR